jgi:sugar (pentulose or hexulose) kinase
MPENLLAIDNGTQSVRALLFDPHGNLIAKYRTEIQPYYSQEPGWAEQDPAVFWDAVCSACQGLWRMPGVDRASIAAVSLTTQRATMLNVDQAGTAAAPGNCVAGPAPH